MRGNTERLAQKRFAANAPILTQCASWLYSWVVGKDGKQGSGQKESESFLAAAFPPVSSRFIPIDRLLRGMVCVGSGVDGDCYGNKEA